MNIRHFVIAAAIASVVVGSGIPTHPQPVLGRSVSRTRSQEWTPQTARDRLKQGNDRFIQSKPEVRDFQGRRAQTYDRQSPFAAVLTCMDSRTPPELIFDFDLGEAFTIRIAGNIINDDILGSLEFAATYGKGVRTIVVLGHTDCGAVKGAIDEVQSGHLTTLLTKIRPAVERVSTGPPPRRPDSKDTKLVEDVTRENVLLAMHEIRVRSRIIRNLVREKGRLDLVGGMYDLKTGRVTFLE